jgi:hypothetical protein
MNNTKSIKQTNLPKNDDNYHSDELKRDRRKIPIGRTREFVMQIFGPTEHEKRVQSLVNAVTGITQAAVLSIHAIGQAYAQLAGITGKSGVKQIDRLLSNENFDIERILNTWVDFVVAERKQIVIALDWTDFDNDKQTTLAAYLVTRHGRATPLSWKTYFKSTLKNNQKDYEYQMIEQLHQWIDPQVEITLLADRGFGDQKLYDFLMLLGWDFVIRFRGDILVTVGDKSQTAAQWVGSSGRAKMFKGAMVTANRSKVPAVVVTWNKKMKEPWCLATTLVDDKASNVVKLYGKRFSIEETFRDQKDLHFGLGLKATHITKTFRRDRLLLLTAVAQALLTLLGAASEATGLDKYLKVNTVKRRTHSLFRQGLYWYHAIETTRDEWLIPLMKEFDRLVREQAVFKEIFGEI